MGRPATAPREKEIEPAGIDFTTPVVKTFTVFKKEHPVPDTRFSDALRYFSQHNNLEDGIKWLAKYMENNHYTPANIEAVKRADSLCFSMATCTLAKLINNGCSLNIDSIVWLENHITEGLRKCSVAKQASAEEKSTRPSVQDHIAAQARNFTGDIALAVDSFLKFKKSDFSAYAYLDTKGVSAPATGYVKKYFITEYAEAFKAATGDEELREGYSYLSDKELLAYSMFLKKIMEDCDRWQNNKKAIRKPRAKKVRSVSSQLAKLKYQREFPELKVVSINPEQILGASSLWLYNTKDRKLCVYMARTHEGFSVKGTTLQGFDEKLSVMKKVRKPELVVNKVIEGGKVVLKHLMEEIKAVEQKATGRINGFTILLKAVK